jgi:hypothetical protein
MKKKLVATVLSLSLASPVMAFFNPMSMMGSMMGSMAAPVISQATQQMLGTLEDLLANNAFRRDVARFMLGTMDEAIYEMLKSMQGEELTFIGALAEVALTNGAEKGSPEYNQMMGFWMTKFGPAMQYRMEHEAQEQAEAQALADQKAAYDADMQRRQELRVYKKYNFDTQEYDLVYKDGWDEKPYIPGES